MNPFGRNTETEVRKKQKQWDTNPLDRETIISKDEIMSLKIDIETLTDEQLFEKYFK
tara:strand:- start:27126 stop:27296 length:171 start_codon:yes stop_codon:yes gene_type:complete